MAKSKEVVYFYHFREARADALGITRQSYRKWKVFAMSELHKQKL